MCMRACVHVCACVLCVCVVCASRAINYLYAAIYKILYDNVQYLKDLQTSDHEKHTSELSLKHNLILPF